MGCCDGIHVPITRSGELGINGDMIFYCGLKDDKVFADSREELAQQRQRTWDN